MTTDSSSACSISGCGELMSHRIITARARRAVRDEDVCDFHARDAVAAWVKDPTPYFGTPSRRENASEFDIAVLIMNRILDSHFVCLSEVGGGRRLSFSIGILEGSALAHQLRGECSRKAFVHDHIGEIITALSGELQDALIYDVDDKTMSFLAQLRIRHHARLVITDIRPSDALCIALSSQVRILVAEPLLARIENMMTEFESQFE
jgi:bifunctional DNase/RNase